MQDGERTTDRPFNWMRYTARALVVAWAGWWTFFGIASGIGEGLDVVGTLIHTAVPGLIFLAVAVVAWRWEAIGGTLLLVMGLLVLVGYPATIGSRFPLATVIFVLLTMAAPPLAAGGLFIASWRRSRA